MKRSTFLFVMTFSSLGWAGACLKPGPGVSQDFKACSQSPQLKWAFEKPQQMTAAMIHEGPSFEPALTEAEKKSSTIFCQYFYHKFSSPGSAKFMCAKTNERGELFDKNNQIVPDAAFVSTREMRLTANLDGETVDLDEGILLDAKKRPLVRMSPKGKPELIEANQLKVKYFVNANQYSENKGGVQRKPVTVNFNNSQITYNNAFEGPAEITNPRWNEVFTEVAATRLFWALGLPADIMIPMDHLVCFGCESHPKVQNEIQPGKVSVFHRVSLEKKMKGSKLGEQFSINQMLQEDSPVWSESTKIDFEQLALAARLIAYHNPIPLQNRMQCEPGQFDKKTSQCAVPVALIQDVGSSWAGEANEEEREAYNGSNPRGALKFYQRNRIFNSENTCLFARSFGSDSKDFKKYPTKLKGISAKGLATFQDRLKNLSPEVIEAIFQVSHYADMEPALRNSSPGATLQDKRQYMIQQWSQALQNQVDDILRAKCSATTMEIGK